MRPLKVRTGPTSPIEAEAIELLRSIERYQPPFGQKQRVRIRLLEHSRPPRVVVPWPAFLAAALLIAVGASAAFSGHLYSNRRVPPPSPTRVTAPLLKPTIEAARNSTAPQETLSLVNSRAEAKPETRAEASVAPSVTYPSRSDPVPRSEASTRALPPPEKVLVFDAMHALRREGHPERAAKLLDEYLRRYPGGSLSEEALALSIEAATALSDPKAKVFAERYLTRYPQGRFRAAAERARAKFSQ